MPYKNITKRKEYHRRWYYEHKEKYKKYQLKNKEKIKKYKKKWYQQNKEKIKKRTQEWQEKNKEQYTSSHRQRSRQHRKTKEWKEYIRQYRKQNLDKYQEYRRRRRVRKKQAEGNHTLGEWRRLKKEYDYSCVICGKQEPKIKLEEDHIIPLTKGGTDYIENIQPLCRGCNSRKNNKIYD